MLKLSDFHPVLIIAAGTNTILKWSLHSVQRPETTILRTLNHTLPDTIPPEYDANDSGSADETNGQQSSKTEEIKEASLSQSEADLQS